MSTAHTNLDLATLVGRRVRLSEPGLCDVTGRVTAVDPPTMWTLSVRTPAGVHETGREIGQCVTFETGAAAVVLAGASVEIFPDESSSAVA